MDSETGALSSAPHWHEHDGGKMLRDFLFWRHLRVVRARAMRHVHSVLGHGGQPVQTVYGVKMMPSWQDRTFAYCNYGTYGDYLRDLIFSIKQPFCFIDIGANQGLFSLIAGQNPACQKIISFEPVPTTFEKLSANLKLNGFDNKATALNAGLSDHAGKQTITLYDEHSGMATLEHHESDDAPNTHKQIVELVTVATLDEQIPDGLPAFVKIDVEGHEQTVIEQLMQSKHRANILGIFYEFDARWSDYAAIEAVLATGGFAPSKQYGRGKHFDVLALPSNA